MAHNVRITTSFPHSSNNSQIEGAPTTESPAALSRPRVPQQNNQPGMRNAAGFSSLPEVVPDAKAPPPQIPYPQSSDRDTPLVLIPGPLPQINNHSTLMFGVDQASSHHFSSNFNINSGDNNRCWLRAAWISVAYQSTPNNVRQIINNVLTPSSRDRYRIQIENVLSTLNTFHSSQNIKDLMNGGDLHNDQDFHLLTMALLHDQIVTCRQNAAPSGVVKEMNRGYNQAIRNECVSDTIFTTLNLIFNTDAIQLTSSLKGGHCLHYSTTNRQDSNNVQTQGLSINNVFGLNKPIALLNTNHYSMYIPGLNSNTKNNSEIDDEMDLPPPPPPPAINDNSNAEYPPSPERASPSTPLSPESQNYLDETISSVSHEINSGLETATLKPGKLTSIDKQFIDKRVHVQFSNDDSKAWMKLAWFDLMLKMERSAMSRNLRNYFDCEKNLDLDNAISELASFSHNLKPYDISNYLVRQDSHKNRPVSLDVPSMLKLQKEDSSLFNEGDVFTFPDRINQCIETLTRHILKSEIQAINPTKKSNIDARFRYVKDAVETDSFKVPMESIPQALGLLYSFFGINCNMYDRQKSSNLNIINPGENFQHRFNVEGPINIVQKVSGENVLLLNSGRLRGDTYQTPYTQFFITIPPVPKKPSNHVHHSNVRELSKEVQKIETHDTLADIDEREPKRNDVRPNQYYYLSQNELESYPSMTDKFQKSLMEEKPFDPIFIPEIFQINKEYLAAKTLPQFYSAVSTGFTLNNIQYPPQKFLVLVHEGEIQKIYGLIDKNITKKRGFISTVLSNQKNKIIQVATDGSTHGPAINYSEYFKSYNSHIGQQPNTFDTKQAQHMTMQQLYLDEEQLSNLIGVLDIEIAAVFKNTQNAISQIGGISSRRHMTAQMINAGTPLHKASSRDIQKFDLNDYLETNIWNKSTKKHVDKISYTLYQILNGSTPFYKHSEKLDSHFLTKLLIETISHFDPKEIPILTNSIIRSTMLKDPRWCQLLTKMKKEEEAGAFIENNKGRNYGGKTLDALLKTLTADIKGMYHDLTHLGKPMNMLEFATQIQSEWAPIAKLKPAATPEDQAAEERLSSQLHTLAHLAPAAESETVKTLIDDYNLESELLRIQKRITDLHYHTKVHQIPAYISARVRFHDLMNQVADVLRTKNQDAKKASKDYAGQNPTGRGLQGQMEGFLSPSLKSSYRANSGITDTYADFLNNHQETYKPVYSQLKMAEGIQPEKDVWANGLFDTIIGNLNPAEILEFVSNHFRFYGLDNQDILKVQNMYDMMRARQHLVETDPRSLKLSMSTPEADYHKRTTELVNSIEKLTSLLIEVVASPALNSNPDLRTDVLDKIIFGLKLPKSHLDRQNLEDGFNYQLIAEFIKKSDLYNYVGSTLGKRLIDNLKEFKKATGLNAYRAALKNITGAFKTDFKALNVPKEVESIIIDHIEKTMNIIIAKYTNVPAESQTDQRLTVRKNLRDGDEDEDVFRTIVENALNKLSINDLQDPELARNRTMRFNSNNPREPWNSMGESSNNIEARLPQIQQRPINETIETASFDLNTPKKRLQVVGELDESDSFEMNRL